MDIIKKSADSAVRIVATDMTCIECNKFLSEMFYVPALFKLNSYQVFSFHKDTPGDFIAKKSSYSSVFERFSLLERSKNSNDQTEF